MGTLSTGATFAFWLFYTILILVAYHKLFAVVYFDTAKGLLREFIIAAIAGIILTGISLSKPIVGIVVIIIVALVGIAKAQSGGGKVVIVLLAIVACVIVGIVGRNVQKNMDVETSTNSAVVDENKQDTGSDRQDTTFKEDGQMAESITQQDNYSEDIKEQFVGTWYSCDGTYQELSVVYNETNEEIDITVEVFHDDICTNIWYFDAEYDAAEEMLRCFNGVCNELINGEEVLVDTNCVASIYSGAYLIWRVETNGADMDFYFTDSKPNYAELKSHLDEWVGLPYEVDLSGFSGNGGDIDINIYSSSNGEYIGNVSLLYYGPNGECYYKGELIEIGQNLYRVDSDAGEEMVFAIKLDEMEIISELLSVRNIGLDLFVNGSYKATYYLSENQSQEEKVKTQIDINAYFNEADTADRMAELLSYDGYDIVFLEDYDGYGLADESLILQNYDIGTCITAEYSEETTVFLMGINTDMSLEEADDTLINYMGAVNTPLFYEGATMYNLSNWYYITLYSAGDKGIKIVAEPYWGE